MHLLALSLQMHFESGEGITPPYKITGNQGLCSG